MTIRTVHQVISKKGALVGEYMNLKHARDMDHRTDVLYFISDIIEAQGVDENTAEKIAEALLEDNTRPELLAMLKGVKDIPAAEIDEEQADSAG